MSIMQNPFESATSPLPSGRKTSARAALVDLKEPAQAILADCFKQFGIQTVIISTDAAERLKKEKFEACVLKLGPAAEQVIEAARNSPSNSRMVIYGIGGSAQDTMRFSKYGINAIFNEPVERPAALKLVRATQMLVVHEFRRYVRLPVITEVSIMGSDGTRFTATSKELSSGGMSAKSNEELSVGASVELSFALLTLPRVWVKGTICWRSKNVFGIRFDAHDERRLRVKEWVDAYLES